jgi:DNA (cytosine-5)-methyltransferase 1
LQRKQVRGLNELALFAGAGGGILGGKLLGWRTICAVESNAYCREVLLQRQAEGHLQRFPIWDDVRTFSGAQWKGATDVVSGGWPCQDVSKIGTGKGLLGERSGLWSQLARIVLSVEPRYVFLENSPTLLGRGMGRVLGDLHCMGFDVEWGVLGARQTCGAPHKRDRVWIMGAHPQRHRLEREREGRAEEGAANRPSHGGHPSWWEAESRFSRVADDVANRVERTQAIGNGQVPAVAAIAFSLLQRRLEANAHIPYQ